MKHIAILAYSLVFAVTLEHSIRAQASTHPICTDGQAQCVRIICFSLQHGNELDEGGAVEVIIPDQNFYPKAYLSVPIFEGGTVSVSYDSVINGGTLFLQKAADDGALVQTQISDGLSPRGALIWGDPDTAHGVYCSKAI